MQVRAGVRKLLCKIFGHKYTKKLDVQGAIASYTSTHCIRCNHFKWADQKIYFSGNHEPMTYVEKGGWIDIS